MSANISIGYYLIYKVFREFGGQKIEARGEIDDAFERERPGEVELVAEMLDIVDPGSAGSSLVSDFAKTAAKAADLADYLTKVTGSFRAYEQDLRDGIADVQLALATYRLRVDTEDSLYDALKQPQSAEELGKVTVRKIGNEVEVNELPSYDQIAREKEEKKRDTFYSDLGKDAVAKRVSDFKKTLKAPGYGGRSGVFRPISSPKPRLGKRSFRK